MKQFTCVFLTIILLLTLAACSKAPEADPADGAPGWQTQYDLGVRYLSEGNYEEAILAFEAAIKIDPKNADAYRKLAKAYEKTGDEDAALRTLETGAEATCDRELADLAGKKRQELDAQPEQPEQPEQTEQSEQPEALDEPEEPAEPEAPDWPSQLSNVVYFGDISNCRMSREASEAYAAVLEQLPEMKTGAGESYSLQAALFDPGDGYPLLVTCYAGSENLYNMGWPVLGEHLLPYQVWTFNGKTAERYPFGEEARAWGSDIQFGTFEGKPGIYVHDGLSLAVGDSEGYIYYTVSEYQLELQHHLWHATEYIYSGDDQEILQRQEATVQDYLDDGWVLESAYNDWSYLIRCELDGTVIRGNDPDYERLMDEYARIQGSFQASAYVCYQLATPIGFIPAPWSSPSEMCAALRGQ